MEEWQQKGVEDWKQNQAIKKDRERRQLEFEFKQTDKIKNFTMNKINEANSEVNEGIEKFERSLREKGIEPKVKKGTNDDILAQSIQQEQARANRGHRGTQSMSKPVSQSHLHKGGPMTLASTGLKTKDKKTITETDRKDRERRRRKMIVDQSKTHYDMEQTKREA